MTGDRRVGAGARSVDAKSGSDLIWARCLRWRQVRLWTTGMRKGASLGETLALVGRENVAGRLSAAALSWMLGKR